MKFDPLCLNEINNDEYLGSKGTRATMVMVQEIIMTAFPNTCN